MIWGGGIILMLFRVILTHGKDFNEADYDKITISLTSNYKVISNASQHAKSILRYGFHRTHACLEFDKAFLCVRKCLDYGYQIAESDKKCICTCYRNKIFAQYKSTHEGEITKWKLGAPTTTRPSWAVPKKPDPFSKLNLPVNDEELYADLDPGAGNATSEEHSGEETDGEHHDEEEHTEMHHDEDETQTEEGHKEEENANEGDEAEKQEGEEQKEEGQNEEEAHEKELGEEHERI